MNEKTFVFMITGKAGHGKDTSGGIIKNYFENKNLDVKTYAFADKLKKICSELFDIPIEYFYDRILKETKTEWGLTPRKMAQLVGTELFREHFYDVVLKHSNDKNIRNLFFGDNIWASFILKQIEKDCPDIAIITDLRFDNEYELFKNNFKNIFCIKVVRGENKNQTQNKNQDKGQDHISEKGLTENYVDVIIDNSGTIEDLENNLNNLLGDYERARKT